MVRREKFTDEGKAGEVDAIIDVENKEDFCFSCVVFGCGGVGEEGIFEGDGESVRDNLSNGIRNTANKCFDGL